MHQYRELQCVVCLSNKCVSVYMYIYMHNICCNNLLNEIAGFADCLSVCRVCSDSVGKGTFGRKLQYHLQDNGHFFSLPISTSLSRKHFFKPVQRSGIQMVCMSKEHAEIVYKCRRVPKFVTCVKINDCQDARKSVTGRHAYM